MDAPLVDIVDLPGLLGLDGSDPRLRAFIHASGTASAGEFEPVSDDEGGTRIADLFADRTSGAPPDARPSAQRDDPETPRPAGDGEWLDRVLSPVTGPDGWTDDTVPPAAGGTTLASAGSDPTPSADLVGSVAPAETRSPPPASPIRDASGAAPVPIRPPAASPIRPNEAPPMDIQSALPPTTTAQSDVMEISGVPGVTGRYRMRIDRVVSRQVLEILLRAFEAAATGDASTDPAPRRLGGPEEGALSRASLYSRAADRIESGMSLQGAFMDLCEGADGLAPLDEAQLEMVRRWVEALGRHASLAEAINRDAGTLEIDLLQLRGRVHRPDWAAALREVAHRMLRGRA